MHWNLKNDEEIGSLKLLNLKYRRWEQIIQPFCRIGSPQELGTPFLICKNFKRLAKLLLNHTECIDIGRMNDLKVLKVNYRREDQIIEISSRFGPYPPKNKLGSQSLICKNSKSLRKVPWIKQNALKSNEWWRNWVLKIFKIEIQKVGGNNTAFLQDWFAPEIRSTIFNL